MRIATFNVENLFRRVDAMYPRPATGAGGDLFSKTSTQIIEDYQRFKALIDQSTYDAATKTELIALLKLYRLHLRDSSKERYFTLREVREKLFVKPKTGSIRIDVNGRQDWEGWIELKQSDLRGAAVANTGRIVKLVGADVLAVVEVEDRTAMRRFSEQVLAIDEPTYGKIEYTFCRLMDGNDDRGIDVGLFSRMPIVSMNSNVDLGLPAERIFRRDCAEYEVRTPGGKSLWLLINHFKSKGSGTLAETNARREKECAAVAGICSSRHANHDYVVVAGDLNDSPGPWLQPLLDLGFRDAMQHPTYLAKKDPTFKKKPKRLGTISSGADKFDYLLLSPALWNAVTDVGVERQGIWAPRTFPHLPEVTSKLTAASDHASLWADINLA